MATVTAIKWLKIGKIAANCGLSVKTIRYYEDLGLLAPLVQRSKSGYRLFQESVFNRLAFIKRAKSLGLSLREIHEILIVHDSGELPCGVIKERLILKLQEINEQLEALGILKFELQGILSGWQDKPSQEQINRTICPNIQS